MKSKVKKVKKEKVEKIKKFKEAVVVQSLVCNECKHEETTHFGGEKGHCNTGGCPCLEFK